jgi:hypothetical protein
MPARPKTTARALRRGFLSAFDVGLRARSTVVKERELASADADGQAIGSDWKRVGEDLTRAAERVKSEAPKG